MGGRHIILTSKPTNRTSVKVCQPKRWWIIRLGMLPLWLSYVAFPLSNQLAELLKTSFLFRNWIDIAWVLLVLGIVAIRPKSPKGIPQTASRMIILILCGAGIVLTISGVISGQSPLLTGAMEVKPIVYILIVILIFGRVAVPSPRDFCRYGAVLSALLIIEAILRSVINGTVMRPIGSGEVNYDAALLCVSLVFAMADGALARRYGWLLWAGIIASFSRTSLVAACLVLLFTSVISLRLRLLMCVLAVGAVLTSFAIRGLAVDNLDSLDRYWMWVAGLDYLTAHPLDNALQTVPGRSIEVDVPRFVADLWINQQESLNLNGIYSFHLHAMWLRLAVSWGWLPVLVGVVIFVRHYVTDRRRAPEARPFFAVLVVLGLTMGLLYLGNVAPVVLLAGYRILLQRRRISNRRCKAGRAMEPVASSATVFRDKVSPAT